MIFKKCFTCITKSSNFLSNGKLEGSFKFKNFILFAADSIIFALRSITRFEVNFFNEVCFISSFRSDSE